MSKLDEAKEFFRSIKIPATNLGDGKIQVAPKENYPPGVIEWIGFNIWISKNGESFSYKVLPVHWTNEEKEIAINDPWGYSMSFKSRKAALKYGIKAAAVLVNKDAWEFSTNPPAISVFCREHA